MAEPPKMHPADGTVELIDDKITCKVLCENSVTDTAEKCKEKISGKPGKYTEKQRYKKAEKATVYAGLMENSMEKFCACFTKKEGKVLHTKQGRIELLFCTFLKDCGMMITR